MQTEFLMNFSLRRKKHEEPSKRSGHVAVHCNGYMLMWGGYKDERHQRGFNLDDRYMKGEEVWCLDIEAKKWQKWTSKRDRPEGMSGSCAVCVGYNMYIIGGHRLDGNANGVLLYQFDVRSKSWTHLEPDGIWPSPRDKFICWPYEDKLVIFGGFGPPPENEQVVKGEWEGDPSSVRFYEHGMEVRGWNNHLFVYDIKTNTWSQPDIQGEPPCPRAAHAGCVIGNRGYVFGGRNGDQRRGDIHYLDLDNMRWSGELNVQGTMPEGRSWHGMAACSDRHLMLYGGFTTNREALGDVWVFDTLSERWTQLNQQTTDKPRLWHTVVSTHSPGEVIAFGGCTNNILDPEQTDIQTNLVDSFYFSPKSLSRLAIESIVHHKDRLAQHIGMLPKSLISRVEDYLQGMISDDTHSHSYNLRSRRSEEQLEQPMDER